MLTRANFVFLHFDNSYKYEYNNHYDFEDFVINQLLM